MADDACTHGPRSGYDSLQEFPSATGPRRQERAELPYTGPRPRSGANVPRISNRWASGVDAAFLTVGPVVRLDVTGGYTAGPREFKAGTRRHTGRPKSRELPRYTGPGEVAN